MGSRVLPGEWLSCTWASGDMRAVSCEQQSCLLLPLLYPGGQCLDLRSRLGWMGNYTTKMSVNLTCSDTWTEDKRPRGGTFSMSTTSSQEQGPGGPPPRPGPLPSCPHSWTKTVLEGKWRDVGLEAFALPCAPGIWAQGMGHPCFLSASHPPSRVVLMVLSFTSSSRHLFSYFPLHNHPCIGIIGKGFSTNISFDMRWIS